MSKAFKGEDASEAPLAAVGQRLAALEERLASAQVVDPGGQPHGEVRFGATATLRSESGEERRYTCVGYDDAR